jgi:hypothetical protein
MKTKIVTPDERHLKFRKALEQSIREGGLELTAEEILAILSHFVGQVIALQDQTKYTTDMVMKLVTENIQTGNREAVNSLLAHTGGNA